MNAWNSLRQTVLGAAFGAAVLVGAPHGARAYPIDCAIVICMAGGFPASSECAAAKREVIRRITPHPVQPPLQLWNCPMGVDPDVASSVGLSQTSLGRDGLTQEVRQIRDAIEIYQINYWHSTGGENDRDVIIDNTVAGTYDEATGEFSWKKSSYRTGPDWLAEVAGGRREPVYETDSEGRRRIKVGEVNDYPGRLRAVALRFRDYEGRTYSEIVRY